MNINLLKIYINKLNKNDINNFLINENIIVNEKELDYLFTMIKNNYEKILNDDKNTINDIKNNINDNAYIKLINILNKYKEVYKKKN